MCRRDPERAPECLEPNRVPLGDVSALHVNSGTQALLELRGVTRRFGGDYGMGPVSFSLNCGEVCSIIGANGSGKSTLLRCTSGFEVIDSGEIRLDGRVVASAKDARGEGRIAPAFSLARGKDIVIVFQGLEPWPHLNVLENVTLPLARGKGMSAAEAADVAHGELTKFGLENRLRALPSQLSGGLRQRVVLARAFALRPRLLLLDEVTASLDPEWTERVRRIVQEYADNGGAVIQVTHRLNLVRRSSSRVLFVHAGLIVADGTPHDVLENPRQPLLRTFLENA